MKKHPGKVLFKGILGIIVFLIFVGILNIVAVGVSAWEYHAVVGFFNYNLLFILLISAIMLVGDVFEAFIFPFRILYPFFNAIGGALYVVLAFRGLDLIGYLSRVDFTSVLLPFYYTVIVVVFVVVLVVGLVRVFVGVGHVEKRGLRHSDVHHEWSDVGDEFKEAAYNLASKVKEKLEPEVKKKRSKVSKKSKKK